MAHKSIKSIFVNKPELADVPEVKVLIDQYLDLVEEHIESQQNQAFSKEKPLLDKIQDIYKGINELFKAEEESERWNEFPKPDFREGIVNLKKDLEKFGKDYNVLLR